MVNRERKSPSANFLICEHWVTLQMSIKECGSWSVVFAKYGAVNKVKAVTGDQLVSARGTGEALKVIDVALCSHDHFTGWYGLTTCAASTRVPKQPDVVCSAEDHASFAVAGGSDISQLSLTA